MKNSILLFALFLQTTLIAQINGNRNIVTKNFPLEKLSELEINLTANITIDMQAKPGITITADENIISYINLEMKDNALDLTQLKWIEPSKNIVVEIGGPDLETLLLDAHSKVKVENLNNKGFKVKANVGKITLEGAVDKLDLNVKLAKVNAEALKVNTANVIIDGWGKVKLGKVMHLNSKVKKESSLTVIEQPERLSGDAKEAIAKSEKIVNEDIRYIKFKIKNNSSSRKHFYVKGPKQDGSYFSYGFPLGARQVKSENWTVGTEIYKVNKLGVRTLLTTIKSRDENEVVDLFKK